MGGGPDDDELEVVEVDVVDSELAIFDDAAGGAVGAGGTLVTCGLAAGDMDDDPLEEVSDDESGFALRTGGGGTDAVGGGGGAAVAGATDGGFFAPDAGLAPLTDELLGL